MNYCECCQIVFEDSICPACGNKKIRKVSREDFILFVTMEETFSKSFIEVLKEDEIECLALPVESFRLNNVNSQSKDIKIFVSYKDIEESKRLLEIFFNN